MSSREKELIVNDRLRIPLSEIHLTYVRSSGPGGQNVNKVSSQAQLRWNVLNSEQLPDDIRARFVSQQQPRITLHGDVCLSSQRYRDRERNRRDCLERLAELLRRAAEPPPVRKKTKKPRRANERRLKDKSHRSVVKRYRRKPPVDD